MCVLYASVLSIIRIFLLFSRLLCPILLQLSLETRGKHICRCFSESVLKRNREQFFVVLFSTQKKKNGKRWKFPFVCIPLLKHVQHGTWKCVRFTFIIRPLNSDWFLIKMWKFERKSGSFRLILIKAFLPISSMCRV